jgi:hypothetical protein
VLRKKTQEQPDGQVEEVVVDQPPDGDEGDEGGQLVAGDGINAPLLEFKASRFRGGRMVTPNVIRIWNDRVEEYEHHAVRHKNTRAINYAQVSQVTINKGLRWSDIRVESTGGQVVTLSGVPNANAAQVKGFLDEKVNAARAALYQPAAPVSAPDTSSSTDRLLKLGEMRQAGLLTDEVSIQVC